MSGAQSGAGPASPRATRTYQAGDEVRLIEIWKGVYGRYAGPVARTLAHWRWSVLRRPGIEPEDIIVVTHGATIVGYGVLGHRGMVLEFTVDATLPEEARAEVAEALISRLETRCLARGYDALSLARPADDRLLARLLRARGYRAESSQAFQLVFVDLRHLLEQLLRHRERQLAPLGYQLVHLRLGPGAYRFCPQPNLTIELGSPPTVSAGTPTTPPTVGITTDASTLTDMMLNRLHVQTAMTAGRVSVTPRGAGRVARLLIDALVMAGPWYTPKADGR